MVDRCGCAGKYHSLLEVLDRVVINLGPAPAPETLTEEERRELALVDRLGLAREALNLAREEAPGVGQACGFEISPVLASLGQVVTALDVVAQQPGLEAPREEAKRTAQEVLRTAERSVDACRTAACACAKSFVGYETLADGAEHASRVRDVAEMAAIRIAIEPALLKVGAACLVPPPPRETIKDLQSRLLGLEQLARRLPGFTSFADTSAGVGCAPCYAQEPGFEELLASLGITPLAEGERSVLDVAPDPGFIAGVERIGFTPDKLAILTVDEYGTLHDAISRAELRRGRQTEAVRRSLRMIGAGAELTVDQVRTMTKEQLKEFAVANPRPPSPTQEALREAFRRRLEARGLRLVSEPGEIIARPPRTLGPGMEPMVPAIIRGPPKVRIARLPKGAVPTEEERYDEVQGTLLEALVDSEAYLQEALFQCARLEERREAPTALQVAGMI